MALLRVIKPNLAWFEYRIELVLRYYTKGEINISFKPSFKIEAKVHLIEGARRSRILLHYSGALVSMDAWLSNLEIAQILHLKI